MRNGNQEPGEDAVPCRAAGRVGIDPIAPVHLMENHDHAYSLWSEAGVKDRILVHIDAHHDMWWAEDKRSTTIANFICPALQEGLVREVYWVVPDASWEDADSRQALGYHLEKILKTYPDTRAARWEKRRAQAEVLKRPLTLCSLGSMPEFSEDVLLDIDIDYLVIPRVCYRTNDTHSPLPWRWPAELVDGLKAKGVSTDFATIVYSVEGGYTPLAWKYLGDEMALRLRFPGGGADLAACDTMREAMQAQHDGDSRQAEEKFGAVGERLGAAAHFQLAHLRAGDGRMEQARRDYARALALDPSYRTPFASPGLLLYWERRNAAAERAFRRTLALDASDAYAHLGLGWVAAVRKRWAEAEAEFQAALASQPDLIDAHRGLAQAAERQHRPEEAIRAYEQSLKLALNGRKAVSTLVVTDPDSARLVDAAHGKIHARLARLYAAKHPARALAGYRMAMAIGYDRPSIHFRVAWLYARERRWREAWEHTAKGAGGIPGAGRTLAERIRRRLLRAVRPRKTGPRL